MFFCSGCNKHVEHNIFKDEEKDDLYRFKCKVCGNLLASTPGYNVQALDELVKEKMADD
jgi:hypothetical protein